MLYLYLSYTFAMQTKLVPWAVIIAISNQIEKKLYKILGENNTRKKSVILLLLAFEANSEQILPK